LNIFSIEGKLCGGIEKRDSSHHQKPTASLTPGSSVSDEHGAHDFTRAFAATLVPLSAQFRGAVRKDIRPREFTSLMRCTRLSERLAQRAIAFL
jgi:hypothetical protein